MAKRFGRQRSSTVTSTTTHGKDARHRAPGRQRPSGRADVVHTRAVSAPFVRAESWPRGPRGSRRRVRQFSKSFS